MKKEMQITVPTMAEVINKKFQLSDYAVATGAVCFGVNFKERQCEKYGEVWLRQPDDEDSTSVLVGHTMDKKLYGMQAFASHNGIAVAPRIKNPEAQGWGVAKLNGQSVLTIRGKVPCYPLIEVEASSEEGKRFRMALQDSLDYEFDRKLPLPEVILHAELPNDDLKEVGAYTSDAAPVRPMTNEPYQPQVNKCYSFHGKNYVYMEKVKCPHRTLDGLYECAAVPAEKCANGDIQLLVGLFASRFSEAQRDYENAYWFQDLGDDEELDTNQFFLGEQLNQVFMHELELSTHFTHLHLHKKLSKGAFPVAGLKDRVKGLLNKPTTTPEIER